MAVPTACYVGVALAGASRIRVQVRPVTNFLALAFPALAKGLSILFG